MSGRTSADSFALDRGGGSRSWPAIEKTNKLCKQYTIEPMHPDIDHGIARNGPIFSQTRVEGSLSGSVLALGPQ